MQAENAIEVKHVTKQFRIYKDKGRTLKERVLFRKRNSYEVRTVLNDISFSVKKGEAVGLIGHNGCGKSTTLKLLTRIIYPDSGSIEVAGRVSSLLELGAGFHPDMSGRENIYINASVFGLTKKEIDDRLERIIEFSELADYIDNPVRTYSSGMYMRLAFSVAINVDADVLLIDEILAVGDANFQKKCFNKLKQIKENGTTIVIVSHSLQQIESICDKSIWINDGVIADEGYTYAVHINYLRFMSDFQLLDRVEPHKENDEENQENAFKIESVEITDEKNEKKQLFELNENMYVHVKYCADKAIKGNVLISVVRRDGVRCYGMEYVKENNSLYEFYAKGEFVVKFTDLQLISNDYHIRVQIEDENEKEIGFDESANFEMKTSSNEKGVFHMNHEWSVNNA